MALDPATVAVLRDHRKRQLASRMLAGPAWSDSFADWQGLSRSWIVSTYSPGSPIHPRR